MLNTWEQESYKKILEPKNIEKVLEIEREKGKTIVSINGSFDLMHAGHLFMLFEAKKQGDVLVVALNTDQSIQRYKDPKRPIISLVYRLQMMAAISFVDFVTYFDELDPREILKKIRPDVHVNGAEYGENCIEAAQVRSTGGRLHLIPRIEGLSTSAIIEKIRQCV